MSFTPYDIVSRFEETIAEYAGSKYAVAVDSCCNALFLCLVYKKAQVVSLPKYTYPGVACSVKNAGAKIVFKDKKWKGIYTLAPHGIVDGALRFCQNMYVKGTFYCLSFHAKKHIPIGRGGMILTDNKKASEWFKKARFDGRSQVPLSEDNIDMIGWNMYMTPEQAARGLMLFDVAKHKNFADIDSEKQGYPDLSTIGVYK